MKKKSPSKSIHDLVGQSIDAYNQRVKKTKSFILSGDSRMTMCKGTGTAGAGPCPEGLSRQTRAKDPRCQLCFEP